MLRRFTALIGACCTCALASPPTQRLVAADPVVFGNFGVALAMDGDTIIVGVERDNELGDRAGAVYVFQKAAGRWVVRQKLFASDAAPESYFGSPVAFDGKTMAITGGGRDEQGLPTQSVYVFSRDGDKWIEQARLHPDDLQPFTYFGNALAIDGEVLVIGDPRDDDLERDAGAVHVFERVDGVWLRVAKLFASDALNDGRFGHSVAINGDTIVIGAIGYDHPGLDRQGAYVFTRDSEAWMEQVKILPDDAGEFDAFGYSVAIEGTIAMIGAPGRDIRARASGAAYVYSRIGDSWIQTDILAPIDGTENDVFGRSVSMDADTAVISATGDQEIREPGGPGRGAAYVFKLLDGTWTEVQELSDLDGGSFDGFGAVTAISDSTAVIGAPGAGNRQDGHGVVYVTDLPTCFADIDCDGDSDADDFFAFLEAFALGKIDVCDLDRDGSCNPDDFFRFLDIFALGC